MRRFLIISLLLLSYLLILLEYSNSATTKGKGSGKNRTRRKRIRKCQRGEFVYKEWEHCLQRLGPMRHPQPCRDLTHLQKCQEFVCPKHYHKCPNSYCIENHRLCDIYMDCPYGEDENSTFCAEYAKPEYCQHGYRCEGERKCVPRHQVCNGFRHCRDGGDEAYCVHCPRECHCNALSYDCRSRDLTYVPFNISHRARSVDLSNNLIEVLETTLDFPYAGTLSLARNEIWDLSAEVFKALINVFRLSLAHNKLQRLRTGLFSRMTSLHTLILTGNPHLRFIEPHAFRLHNRGSLNLQNLNLSGLHLETLYAGSFSGLGMVKSLDLSHNQIASADDNAFANLTNLVNLNMSNNPVMDSKGGIFSSLTGLKTIRGDHYAFCCFLSSQIKEDDCSVPAEVFSSCVRLIASETLRIFLWGFAVIGICGHTVLIMTELSQRSQNDVMNSLCRVNISLSSYVLSVYCLLITVVDTIYAETYIATWWRRSFPCHLIGGLFRAAYVEIQFTIIFSILMDRYVTEPREFWKGKRPAISGSLIMVISWVFALALSMPSKFMTSFGRDEAIQSAVCISLPTAIKETDHLIEHISFVYVTLFLQTLNVMSYFQFRYQGHEAAYVNLADKQSSVAVELATRPFETATFMVVAGAGLCATKMQLNSTITGYLVLFVLPLPGQLRPLMAMWRAVFVKKNKRPVGGGASSSIDKSQTLVSEVEMMEVKAKLTSGGMQEDKLGGFKLQGRFRRLQHVIDDESTTISCREILNIAVKIAKALDFMDNNGFRCTEFNAEDIYLKDAGVESRLGKLRFEDVKLCLNKVQKDLSESKSEKSPAVECLGEIISILIGRC